MKAVNVLLLTQPPAPSAYSYFLRENSGKDNQLKFEPANVNKFEVRDKHFQIEIKCGKFSNKRNQNIFFIVEDRNILKVK